MNSAIGGVSVMLNAISPCPVRFTARQEARADIVGRTVFARYAPGLVQAGYSPLPRVIRRGHGRPAVTGWSDYCERPLNAQELEQRSDIADADISLACGFGGLTVIDVDDDDPQILAAVRVALASLAFLECDLAGKATELGWGTVELFGVFNHPDAAVVNRRPASKGLVSFAALAPWPGTHITGIEATHAIIATSAGGMFRSLRRPIPAAFPFWQLIL